MGNNGVVEKGLELVKFKGKEYKLLDKERLFALAYCQNNGNSSAAAVTAGYSTKTKGEIGYELLRRPRVREFIQAIQDDIATMLGISAIDIAREYAKIGFLDIRTLFDPETGQVLDPKDIPDKTAGAIASYEALEVYEPRTGKFIGKNKKIKFHDKVVALDKLARMMGMDAKSQDLEPAKPAPLEITIKRVDAKIKKNGNDGTSGGDTK